MAASPMRRVKLKEVCERITVGHVGPMASKYVPVGIPFLRSQNIAPFRLDTDDIKFVSREFHEKLRKSALRPGDVAVVRTGYPGTACVIPDAIDELNCADLVVITPSSELNPHYLAAIFNSAWGRASVAGNLVGVAQQHFNIGAAKELEVGLPTRPIQDRIAGILSAYDELIENSQRRIKILESMARALYREWFVHYRFPGHESVPRVPSSQGEIPQGWKVKELGDLCELRKDAYRDSDHSGLPLLDMARMPSRMLAPSETGAPSELTTSRILFQKGDTLFGAIRCYLHKVVAAHFPGVTNTSVLVLRPRSPGFRALVSIVASDIETIRWAETQSTGTKMPVINWGVFQSMPVPIPSKDLAQAFEDIAGPMLDEVGILAAQIQTLRRTRDLLLPRLLSGQIDVDAMPS